MGTHELPKDWLTNLEVALGAYTGGDLMSVPADVVRGLLALIPQTIIVRLGRDEVYLNFLDPQEQRLGRGPAVTSVLYHRREVPSVSVVWRGEG